MLRDFNDVFAKLLNFERWWDRDESGLLFETTSVTIYWYDAFGDLKLSSFEVQAALQS